MKGLDYLNFIADLYDIPADQRTADIGKYADAFELTGNLGSPIGSYSHGMRQKLALISAFIRRPRLLILDEPFVGLDPAAAHLMKGYLAELCQGGSAVFFSTHVLEVAEKLCHKIAIIQHGRLVKSGPTAELVDGLLFTTFAVKGVVFGGKDNDLLLSMPVSSTLLMASRVTAIYLENLLFSAFVLLPAGVVCTMLTQSGVGHSLLFWVRLVIAALTLPLLPMAAAVICFCLCTCPKLDAVNETVVIKQSLAATLAMFVPMAALAAAGGLYWLGSQTAGWAALALPILLFALLTAVCAAVLSKRGPVMLQAL